MPIQYAEAQTLTPAKSLGRVPLLRNSLSSY